MPPAASASDADLAARAVAGSMDSVVALRERHVDAVHDHVARWSRDAVLAAEGTTAAFEALLGDLAVGEVPPNVRRRLLHDARAHVLRRLRDADGIGSVPVSAAVLGAGGPTSAAVWSAASELEEPTFSVLDLHVRQGLDATGVAAVLGIAPSEVLPLLQRVRSTGAARLGHPIDDYGALPLVTAPTAVRGAVTRAAVTQLGVDAERRATARTAAAAGAALVVVLVLAAAALTALRGPAAEPAAGPATVAAEPVASPTPSPTPTPEVTPTLDVLASPVPVPSPEPTVAPSPTPAPSPSPEPSPSPTPPPVVVAVVQPSPGTTAGATEEDGSGRQAARVGVQADVTGGSGSATVTWRSSLAPDDVLLTGSSGEVLLWLAEDCTDTTHELTATATDETTGQTASDSVTVTATETCVEPLVVDITSPSEGATVTAQRDGPRHVATFDVAAATNGDGLVWAWTSDRSSEVLLDQQSGRVRVVLEDCTGQTVPLTVLVEVERTADGSDATDQVGITVACVG